MISKLTLVLVFCVSLLLIGCGKSNPMVGTWSLAIDENMKKLAPAGQKLPVITATFKADNTYVMNAEVFGQSHSLEGTYKLEEKKLTLTVSKDDGQPPKAPKDETVTLSEDGKSFDVPGAPGMGKMVKQ